MAYLLQTRRAILAGLIALFMFSGAMQAQAAQTEMDLLSSYVGDWRGSGELVGGDEPERFTCRMTINQGNAAKINFAGRCAVAGLNLSVRGTIAYNDEARRYEGIMTSNTAYSGLAIGRRSGDSIRFDFQRREVDDKGQDMTVDSHIVLNSAGITVEFEVTFNDSGDKMHTSVPFERH